MGTTPRPIAKHEYHVFVAAPGDMDGERRAVQRFFNEFNRSMANDWGVRFEVIDWENSTSAGVGEPQKLITAQTLRRYRDSLVLVIGLMGQRFGLPTSTHESGTEEEFEIALQMNQANGWPEIKWFFKRITESKSPSDPSKIEETRTQWERVQAFKARLKSVGPGQLYYREFDEGLFSDELRRDLDQWLSGPERPWLQARSQPAKPAQHKTTSNTLSVGLMPAGYTVRGPESLEYPILEALYQLRFSGLNCRVSGTWQGSFTLTSVPQPLLRAWLRLIPDELAKAIERLRVLEYVESTTSSVSLPFAKHSVQSTPKGKRTQSELIIEKPGGGHVQITVVRDGRLDTILAFGGTLAENTFQLDDPGALTFNIAAKGNTPSHSLTTQGIKHFEQERESRHRK